MAHWTDKYMGLITPVFKTDNQEKWSRHYYKLCNRALGRKPKKSVYYEQHHMLPKCQWGSNEIIVLLTPEEHYVAHQLLVKMFPSQQKLAFAANMMASSSKGRSNKTYGWLKKRMLGRPAWNKGKPGTFTGKKHTRETKQKIAECHRLRSDEDAKIRSAKISKARLGKPTRLGVPNSMETRKKLSDALKGREPARRVSVIINGVYYKYTKDAMKQLQLSRYVITKRLESDDYPNYTILKT